MSRTSRSAPEAARGTGAVAAGDPPGDGGPAGAAADGPAGGVAGGAADGTAGGAADGTAGGPADGIAGGPASGAAGVTGSASTGGDRICVSCVQPPSAERRNCKVNRLVSSVSSE